MSFRDWDEADFQEFNQRVYENIFDRIESIQEMDRDDQIHAEELFEAGWLTWGVYDKDQLEDLRDQFYDFVGMIPEDFDWEEFRESYDEING